MRATPSSLLRRPNPITIVLAILSILVVAGISSASALPPDGPGPETPGTSSRVWPAEVAPGGVLNFEVAGYPANETVYIKIDDGTMCTDSSHGACVYHTQKLDGNGYAKGTIVLPESLPEGAHWLRMLATGPVIKDGEEIGYTGFTRRGGNDFTIRVGATADGSGTPTTELANVGPADGTDTGFAASEDEDGTSTSGGGATTEGGTIELNTDGGATETEQDGAAASGEDAENVATVVPPEQSSGVPVVGIAALGGALVVGVGLVSWALLRRKRAATALSTANH